MSINIKDIKNKDKCIKNDISNISENKGILLALLYFILKKYKHLINLKIKINLSKYQKILKLLFSDLKFTSSDKDTFNININTKEQGNLNITYINFLEEIKANKIYIVPWFDGDNPLIMFMKSKKIQNINEVNKKIVDWHNCSRTQPLALGLEHMRVPEDKHRDWSKTPSERLRNAKHFYPIDIPYNKFNNYDEFIENNILNKYITFNNKWSYNDLITYINTSLSNQIIIKKTIEKKIQVPVPTPYLVPIPMNNINQKEDKIDLVELEKNTRSKIYNELNLSNILSILEKIKNNNINFNKSKENINKIENMISQLKNNITNKKK